MKRLHITAEGQTEEAFVNKTLKLYLARFCVYADVRCVMTGHDAAKKYRGGMTNYAKAKKDITNWLKEESRNHDVVFTTMFDYYALPNDFPGVSDASSFQDPYARIKHIEKAFFEDVADRRFIPYIQLHEFESLLFVNPQLFELEFFDREKDIQKLVSVAKNFGNPELINNGYETAPSKRIIDALPDYQSNKPTIGSVIANEIGIEKLKESCQHFREWVNTLEQLNNNITT